MSQSAWQPPPRRRRDEDGDDAKPLYAVWEITLHCDQPCQHCGSRAGSPRKEELSTSECLEVVASLARLGCREIVLIGGEAYLRQDIATIVAALAEAGMRVTMQTGGRGLNAARVVALADAGLRQIGVSVDGTEGIHDELRGNPGSHAAALSAMDHARTAGLGVTANSQINRRNMGVLRELAAELRAHGASAWKVGLTVPMGRAADRPSWLLPPHKVIDVIDTLAAIQLEAAQEATGGGRVFDIRAGNTLGYFGPHEQVIRSTPGGIDEVWAGCIAGYNSIGIESDGSVKGCPSLPSGPYVGGNVRELTLDRIWWEAPELGFTRERALEELWGHCRDCYYASVCKGGCSWMAHTTFGRRGNNPFCYHRVEQLRDMGLRERLVPRRRAPDVPYDFGGFDLEEVPWDTPEDEDPVMRVTAEDRRRLPIAGQR